MRISKNHDPRDISRRKIISLHAEILQVPNNCFTDWKCCLCGNWYELGDNVFQCESGDICYRCKEKLHPKRKVKK